MKSSQLAEFLYCMHVCMNHALFINIELWLVATMKIWKSVYCDIFFFSFAEDQMLVLVTRSLCFQLVHSLVSSHFWPQSATAWIVFVGWNCLASWHASASAFVWHFGSAHFGHILSETYRQITLWNAVLMKLQCQEWLRWQAIISQINVPMTVVYILC